MTAELAIVSGLSMVTSILAYMTFNFLDRALEQGNSDDRIDWQGIIGIMLLLLTIIFVNIIIYTLVLIAQNNGISYLNDTTLLIALQTTMWATLGSVGLYLFTMLLSSGYFIVQIVKQFNGKHSRKKTDG